jgi:hypothetical protein
MSGDRLREAADAIEALPPYVDEKNVRHPDAIYRPNVIAALRAALSADPPQTGDAGAALDRMERTLPQYVDMDGLHWWPCADVRAILRASSPVAPDAALPLPGLDVERLARALVWRRYGIRVDDANPADRDDAAVIAAEYARLSVITPQPDSETKP